MTEIRIDITDWVAELEEAQPTVLNEDDIVRLLLNAVSTGQVAKYAIAARETGIAPTDILKPNKILLYAGARADIVNRVGKRQRTLTLDNGREIEVREMLGRPGEQSGDEGEDNADDQEAPSWVLTTTEAGITRAQYYLRKVVPGHVYDRLKEIAAGGGDVRAAVDELEDTLEDMVTRLT